VLVLFVLLIALIAGAAKPHLEGAALLAAGIILALVPAIIWLTLFYAQGRGPRPTPTPQPPRNGVQIYGRITDAETGRGIAGAYFVVLQPGITEAGFEGEESQIYTIAETNHKGNDELPLPLARDETYSIIVVAEGYQPIAEDDVYVDEDTESPLEVNKSIWS
jgi:hypothetical protein